MKHRPPNSFLAFFLCLAAAAAVAQAPRPASALASAEARPRAPRTLPADPAELLGASPSELFARYGAPDAVYAVRGAEAWQDDVAFDYTDFAAFLFGGRVWQLLIRPSYREPVWGFIPGAELERIQASLGLPAPAEGGQLEWSLPYRGWPVRLRVLFGQAGRAEELYLYRADF